MDTDEKVIDFTAALAAMTDAAYTDEINDFSDSEVSSQSLALVA